MELSDSATISTSNITVGIGKTLDVTYGTLTLANDQISGDKVEGGTINATTINTLHQRLEILRMLILLPLTPQIWKSQTSKQKTVQHQLLSQIQLVS